ncbi:hypothetical protein TRFO_12238 [Tritrichomonas foetus]|uniref:Armadillo/beta-catenin-like repeat family protein n=1 Tax=Tritrichomonas foetus TaxID=1144522 RepID=A0A1J4J6Q6_9EUKA|nr:hypothetical protein TRFO_12238 [Tritrichomonas foetus]|eukprot:OHS92868.1 hypothetical protein TRFO_12238 [Tritrichomonas foetus]
MVKIFNVITVITINLLSMYLWLYKRSPEIFELRFFPQNRTTTDMEGDPNIHQGPEPDELEIGFLPNHPDLVIPQIQKLSLTNRTIGLETLINITNDGPTPDTQKLIEAGVFPLVISQINESNMKIIGLVCTALRHLSSVAPQVFRELMGTIPIPFLLAIPDCPEVIDFLQASVFNFSEFAALLLSNGPAFLNAIGVWLQAGEQTALPTLELINALSQIEGIQFDFNCIKPFLDGQFSPDIRSLAMNILLQVEPQNAQMYLQMLMEMFMNDNPTSTVFQIIHDDLSIFPDFFQSLIPQLFQRSIQFIQVPESAIVLADIAPHIDQAGRENIITQIFSQPQLCPERADAIFRICNDCEITLPPSNLAQLVTDLATNESEDTLQCTEAILVHHSPFFASPEVQTQLLPVFQRDPNFAVFAFRIVLYSCGSCAVVPPVLEAFRNFAVQFESSFEPELHKNVKLFLDAHQA